MEPTLRPGDVVFVNRALSARQSIREGDVVVASHPHTPEVLIIKRIEFLTDGSVYLMSDNRASSDASDSRRFGVISTDSVVGKVTAVARGQR